MWKLMVLHLPKNHRFRGLYRFLALLAALYVIAFGFVGAAVSRGHALFSRDSIVALGLRTNLAFSLLSIVVGVLVLVGLAIGRNWDAALNVIAGTVFLLAGMFMLGLLQTKANLLNYSVTTCVVSFVIGLIIGTAGMYTWVGPEREPDGASVRPAAPVRA